MTVQPLRIAIVGGGIAGAAIWIALQHFIEAGLLEIAIFDAASALREVGASIAVQVSCLYFGIAGF
jgi:2-polyprenyl-6-methoxyphenol hydroxylase-like FAD-dependent oxidoreductase